MITPLLVYASQLRQAEYARLRDIAALQAGVIDIALIDSAMRLGVDKRLELANSFLEFAKSLTTGAGDPLEEIAARNAVSRAYYATYHALRALILFEERDDIEGHRDLIEAVTDLLRRSPALRAKLGTQTEFKKSVLLLLEQRHLADYYPYGTDEPLEMPADFEALASDALTFAQRILDKVREYIRQKEARV